jgi:hypothetical protein
MSFLFRSNRNQVISLRIAEKRKLALEKRKLSWIAQPVSKFAGVPFLVHAYRLDVPMYEAKLMRCFDR